MNSIVPYRDDLYYTKRPNIHIPAQKVLRVSDNLGFNPAMSPLAPLFESGEMTVINSVGYPNPNRSHFRSMDIWQSGISESEVSTGWLGRYLDNDCSGEPLHLAMEIGDSLSLAMKGEEKFGMAASSMRVLMRTAEHTLKDLPKVPSSTGNESLDYLYKTANAARTSVDYLHGLGNLDMNGPEYPQNAFGKNLKLIANLVKAGSETQVYYTSLDGFDTHVGQPVRHSRLLEQYSQGVRALVDDLRKSGQLDSTLILTFSEFGRRITENASRGTDHGTANNVYLFGGKVNGGMHNSAADLSRELNNDLVHEVDFRSVYATILSKWFEADAEKVLKGTYPGLNILNV